MSSAQEDSNNLVINAEEQKLLAESIRRAQQFEKAEDLDLMRQPLEGYLLKFTNAFQGWQHRWFVLDPNRGELRYYLKQEHAMTQKHRGILHLAGAHIVPNEEDSLAFSVTPANHDSGYRLKAPDTKLKQEWINRLRTVAEDHFRKSKDSSTQPSKTPVTHDSVRRGTAKEGALFHNLHKVLSVAVEQQNCLSRAIDRLPIITEGCLDPNVLSLKSDANTIMNSLDQCLRVLKDIQTVTTFGNRQDENDENETANYGSKFYVTASGGLVDVSSSNSSLGQDALNLSLAASEGKVTAATVNQQEFSTFDESKEGDEALIETSPTYVDVDVGSVETQKNLILSLLSHLKLGTDLTRVPLPTFILQSRSLLETYSDFFANSPLLLNVPDLPTPELRMIGLLKWFLTSFKFGCKDGLARKPYNPVLGEIFRCTWVSKDAKAYKLQFIGEQVSHHPPLSAFFVSCPEKGIYLNASIWPKSKFMGTSLSATMVGTAKLILTNLKSENEPEVYTFTLPTCFARSILTTPWFELGGKVLLTNNRSDIQASVVFQTKPFYGGKLHHVTAEVKKNVGINGGKSICRVSGEWNKNLEFVYEDGSLEFVEVQSLPWSDRVIRPVEKQARRESRRLWNKVTESLRNGNLDQASLEKQKVEDAQRNHVKQLQKQNASYTSAYFTCAKNEGCNVAYVCQKMPDV